MDTAVLQITTKCPFYCKQCYMVRDNRDMQYEVAVQAINTALNLGAKAVQLTGGEPLCHEQIARIVKYCADRNVYSMIATSGHNHSASTYRELSNMGLSAICISLNSIDESINGNTREGYNTALLAIKDAVSVDLPCFVNIVLTHDNIASLKYTIMKLKEMDVCGIQLLKRYPNFKGENRSQVTMAQLSKVRELVLNDKEFVQIENCYKEYWLQFEDVEWKCDACGNKSVFWNVDGSVSPCSQKTKYRYLSINGLIRKKDDWNGEC